MKNYSRVLLGFLLIMLMAPLFGQQKSPKPYIATDGEMIFGFNQLTVPDQFFDRKMRFSFFPHLDFTVHKDFNKYMGIYAGIGHQNIGLRFEDSVKKMHRSLVVNAPIGLKFGNFEKGVFLFGGVDFGYFYHYKQRYSVGEDKFVIKEFNSDRINNTNWAWFVGMELPGGLNLRFKYYMNDFFNQGYTNEIGAMPYAGASSRIWYISIGSRNVLGGNRWREEEPEDE